jgi:uncharacterized membrane protein YsdA (DUF1294 family)
MAGVAGVVLGLMPVLLEGAYFAMSALSYLMYRSDKIAARSDAQRTPEASLHLVGLLGGWPGALIAQQWFRHKTAKRSFQVVFWATVVVNLAAVAWLRRSGLLAGLMERVGG